MLPGPAPVNVGIVSFLNARPLVDVLWRQKGWTLVPAVPSALLQMIDDRRVGIALLPVVDLARRPESLQIISDACIAADGEVQTVMVYSRVPPERIRRMAADPDSHTSVALARLIWRRQHQVDLALVDPGASADAELMIGDKVMSAPPRDSAFRIDLAAAWKQLTGLPIVFAIWACHVEAFDLQEAAAIGRLLSAARDEGVRQAAALAQHHAESHGWSVASATRYLTDVIRYKLDHAAAAGMRRFLHDAREERLL